MYASSITSWANDALFHGKTAYGISRWITVVFNRGILCPVRFGGFCFSFFGDDLDKGGLQLDQ